jgi:hypothetical protein
MNSLHKQLNEAGRGEGTTFIKLNSLDKNKKYKVESLKWQNTKYGKSIVAGLADIGQVFLPRRFGTTLDGKTNDDFATFVADGINLLITGEGELGGFKTQFVEFVK